MTEQLQEAKKFMDSILALYRPMTKEELCEYLKIEPHTLERYNAKNLPRTKMGNEVRYSLIKVLDWFDKRSNMHTRNKENFSFESEEV